MHGKNLSGSTCLNSACFPGVPDAQMRSISISMGSVRLWPNIRTHRTRDGSMLRPPPMPPPISGGYPRMPNILTLSPSLVPRTMGTMYS